MTVSRASLSTAAQCALALNRPPDAGAPAIAPAHSDAVVVSVVLQSVRESALRTIPEAVAVRVRVCRVGNDAAQH